MLFASGPPSPGRGKTPVPWFDRGDPPNGHVPEAHWWVFGPIVDAGQPVRFLIEPAHQVLAGHGRDAVAVEAQAELARDEVNCWMAASQFAGHPQGDRGVAPNEDAAVAEVGAPALHRPQKGVALQHSLRRGLTVLDLQEGGILRSDDGFEGLHGFEGRAAGALRHPRQDGAQALGRGVRDEHPCRRLGVQGLLSAHELLWRRQQCA